MDNSISLMIVCNTGCPKSPDSVIFSLFLEVINIMFSKRTKNKIELKNKNQVEIK